MSSCCLTTTQLLRPKGVGVVRGLELWKELHDVGRGSSDLVNREEVKSYTYPRRSPNLDDLAVKLDLWKGLRAQLEALGEVFTERQHWMAFVELVPADMLAEMQDIYMARLDFVRRRVSHHRALSQRSKEPALVDARRSWPCRLRPASQIRSTSWLKFSALGKTGYKGKKGGGAKGFGGKGKGDIGPNGAINGSCWN